MNFDDGYSTSTNPIIRTNVNTLEVTFIDNLGATDVEGALYEHQIDIDNLEALIGVNEATDLGTFTGTTIQDNRVCDDALQDLATFQRTHIDNTTAHNLTKAQVGLGNVLNTKSNYASDRAPNVNDDNTQGYSKGSIWLNNVGTVDGVKGDQYICVDDTTSAAIWNKIATNQEEKFFREYTAAEYIKADSLVYLDDTGKLKNCYKSDMTGPFYFTFEPPSFQYYTPHDPVGIKTRGYLGTGYNAQTDCFIFNVVENWGHSAGQEGPYETIVAAKYANGKLNFSNQQTLRNYTAAGQQQTIFDITGTNKMLMLYKDSSGSDYTMWMTITVTNDIPTISRNVNLTPITTPHDSNVFSPNIYDSVNDACYNIVDKSGQLVLMVYDVDPVAETVSSITEHTLPIVGNKMSITYHGNGTFALIGQVPPATFCFVVQYEANTGLFKFKTQTQLYLDDLVFDEFTGNHLGPLEVNGKKYDLKFNTSAAYLSGRYVLIEVSVDGGFIPTIDVLEVNNGDHPLWNETFEGEGGKNNMAPFFPVATNSSNDGYILVGTSHDDTDDGNGVALQERDDFYLCNIFKGANNAINIGKFLNVPIQGLSNKRSNRYGHDTPHLKKVTNRQNRDWFLLKGSDHMICGIYSLEGITYYIFKNHYGRYKNAIGLTHVDADTNDIVKVTLFGGVHGLSRLDSNFNDGDEAYVPYHGGDICNNEKGNNKYTDFKNPLYVGKVVLDDDGIKKIHLSSKVLYEV